MKTRFSNEDGVLDFFGSEATIKALFPVNGCIREKFSIQLFNHFPLWVQIKTDIDGERLNQ